MMLRNAAALAIILVGLALGGIRAAAAAVPDPLLDWSDWERYRATVRHPSVTRSAEDLARARENLRRHEWARQCAATVAASARERLARLTPEFIAAMVPETTPGDLLFTPCPACRDQHKPVHPHGNWAWSVDRPDQLACTQCGTVFPNPAYPENLELRTSRGRPQTLTWCGAAPFEVYGYLDLRPSFAANLRARQVRWIAETAQVLAEAHLLTGQPEYAVAVRNLLLRLAACYPGWLIHVGYGEYTDLNPRMAAGALMELPEPELCPPPAAPDRRLHTGHWSAGRATGTGMEANFVRLVVDAYDWTCAATDAAGQPVYQEEERIRIERDLLLESTILLVGDKSVNNKSVGNRTAVALVGMCVGHPGLVRFGLEGFRRALAEWFLPDGTPSESMGYGTMALWGIWDLPQACRGYADPPGYRDAADVRLERLDLYRDPAYAQVWKGFFRGLQGDLVYPPLADSPLAASLHAQLVELMVANYPDRPEYLALLRATNEAANLAPGAAPPNPGIALYLRDPDRDWRAAPPLALPDWCPPAMRIGHLRTGADGRESLLTLSASGWGNHHHLDSLGLYYWCQGRELLSDLGYLWDHPDQQRTVRTLAHHTVILDGQDQQGPERGGEVRFFQVSAQVKAMEAESRAYPQASLYRRTVALVDHGEGRSYAVDFFRVAGGSQQDYVYHASAPTCEVLGLELAPAPDGEPAYDLAKVRTAPAVGLWRAVWACGPDLTGVAWNLGQPGEQALVGDGWGQRDWHGSDRDATLPYLIRRATGPARHTFVSIFAAHPAAAAPFVRNARLLDSADTLVVETELGQDYIMSTLDAGTLEVPLADGAVRVAARFAIVSVRDGKEAWRFVVEAEPEPTPGASPPHGAP